MSGSYKEEVLSLLAAICSILCFGFGFDFAGWAFCVKAVADTVISLRLAIREIRAKKANESSKDSA